jgi:hypothetical protein
LLKRREGALRTARAVRARGLRQLSRVPRLPA